MKLKFTKMQGCGNDYVYINGFTEHIPQDGKEALVIRLSERHFGIGSDGVIFINPSDIADFEMEMYNADGSRSEMCGNGMRCVTKYVYDNRMTDKKQFTVASYGRIYPVTVFEKDGKAEKITVDMGEPILKGVQIPVNTELTGCDSEGRVIDREITVLDRTFKMTCVSMGNPHCVVFTDTADVEKYGAAFEVHPDFPKRVNAEFVEVTDRKNVSMRVFERGTGETLACGTGCCATAAACILNGLTDDCIDIHVLGGVITVEWNRETGHILMSGPAAVSFTGETEI